MKSRHVFGLAVAMAVIALPIALTTTGCSDDDATTTPPGPLDGATPTDGSPNTNDGTADGQPTPTDGGQDGEASTPDSPLPSGVRDRAGRAYVSLLLVSAANKENYNAEPVDTALATDPVLDDDSGTPTFGADFQAALTMLDGLDGVNNWNGGGADAGPDDAGIFQHPLTNAWIGVDALVVDPTKPFSASGYLDIEVNADAHTTCGGRWFGDDALDKTMSYLVNKSLTGISDGVSAPAKPASQTFPYLAEPF